MSDRKRRFGDRYDGRLVRGLDPFFKIMPYIMKDRVDSMNFFEDKIDITGTEAYLRAKRDAGIKNIGFLHIVIAALVRTMAVKPGINRFIAGQRIYARNEILVSLALKKEMREEGLETTVKIKFEPTDTLADVVARVNAEVGENKKAETENGTDQTAKLFTMIPGFLLKFVVWALKKLDYYGWMPKIINQVSPFHTSVFVTDLGSLGIQPVYHHLYEFGTTSVFVAFGTKQREKTVSKDNEIVTKEYVYFKVSTDERTVDGFYYAKALKVFKSMIQHPERLELPPEQVVEDLA
ncbi:MAG: 2-oxo acid dehydrogenase subunit E2 [Mycobacterium leprae]